MSGIHEEILQCAEQLVQTLKARGTMVATAESCTGGWVAKAITDVAGSSAVFDRGFITYSNDSKMELLAVSPRTIEKHGAVSQNTVEEMAAGALSKSNATLTVAVSGIAGPSGGTEEKPVGTVWLAWAQAGTPVTSRLEHLSGDRDSIRAQATMAALNGIQQLAQKKLPN